MMEIPINLNAAKLIFDEWRRFVHASEGEDIVWVGFASGVESRRDSLFKYHYYI
jgi:hypothetical protein